MSHNLPGDESCTPQARFCLLSAVKGALVEGAECHVLEHLEKSLVLPSQAGDTVRQDSISQPVLEWPQMQRAKMRGEWGSALGPSDPCGIVTRSRVERLFHCLLKKQQVVSAAPLTRALSRGQFLEPNAP